MIGALFNICENANILILYTLCIKNGNAYLKILQVTHAANDTNTIITNSISNTNIKSSSLIYILIK